MSITIGKKQFRLTDIGLGACLVLLYLLRVSFLNMDLSVPFAFLWLMWTLTKIAKNQEAQRQKIEQLEAR